TVPMGNLTTKIKRNKNERSRIFISSAAETPTNIDNKLLFNNDEEIDRVQVEHHMYRTVWGGNFLSPVREMLMEGGATVLDFGCGPGTWTCDMSSDFPKSTFVGVEVASLFPTIYPSNVQFIKCDLNGGLPFNDNQFDFVYLQLKYLNYTKSQWNNLVIQELVRVLKPGGWIELFELECDGINNGPISKKYVSLFREACSRRDLDPDLVFHLPQIITSTKGIDPTTLRQVSKIVPLGPWGGKLGEIIQNNCVKLMRKQNIVLRITEKEARELVEKQQHELCVYKTSIKLYRFYAMKSLGK
ncbi:7669_t:CDS:2, partial [Acaulospora morrowiae]